MSESAPTESQEISSDEDTQDSPSKDTMDVEETQSESDTNDNDSNKENKNKSSKKRKNTSPDTDINPKKKRKINKDNDTTNTNETKKKSKKRRSKPKKKDKDKDNDEDTEMTEEEKEERRKHKKKLAQDRATRVAKQLHESVPEYLRLSDDESNSNNKNKKKKHSKKKEKSNRLLKQQQALMTQEGDNYDSDNDIMDSDDENEDKTREKNIKHLSQVKLEEIALLETQTIHRLCRTERIDIHKKLTKAQEKEKEELKKKGKKGKKFGGYEYIEKKKLIKELKKEKKVMNKEEEINNLEDVNDKEDIGDFRRETIVRLCKTHRIPANQKLIKMIEDLEERYDNPSDEDDYIETLKDIKDIDEIQHLHRDVLIRLCNKHNVETVRRKKKKKKRKRTDDSDSDNASDSDNSVIDLEDKELIKALEDIKKRMNEQKRKHQNSQISKLELIQENMLNIGFRDNYLTISGSEDFKDKCRNLIAVCNSEVTNKSLCYDCVDDVLGPYKVCVTENNARTLKVMMTIARGGSIVNDKWISHSIKGKKWIKPTQYENTYEEWKIASKRSRESFVSKRKKKKKVIDSDDENDMNLESDEDSLDKIDGRLLKDYSIYVQHRPGKIKPSALELKHLAWNAGAQIVNSNWEYERLKQKEADDGLDDEKDKKKKSKKSKKVSKRRRRNKQSDEENESDNENESEEEKDQSDSGNDKEEVGDEDSDMEDKNKNKKKKKGNKKKKERIKSSRNRDSVKGKSKRVTKLREYKLIITHPAIHKNLKHKKNKKDIDIVGQQWLFDSIEHFSVQEPSDYIVKPNKNQSRSPAH